MQVEPVKPELKAPGSMLLQLKYDEPPSNFVLNFNSRLYPADDPRALQHQRALRITTEWIVPDRTVFDTPPYV